MNRIFCSALIFCLLSSCIPDFGAKEPKEKKNENLVKTFYPDGTLKTEVPIENKKKNGLAKAYYADGKLRQSIEYMNGFKHGEATTYYENGNKYQVSRYKYGKLHGIRERYHEDGKLMSEVPYYEGDPAAGLKEYLLDGSLKKKYPHLVIKAEDQLIRNNVYKIHLQVSDGNKRVKYYLGSLDENGVVPKGTPRLEDNGKGKATMEFALPPGAFIMKELPLIAEVTTLQGNTYFIQHKHNLSVENRNF